MEEKRMTVTTTDPINPAGGAPAPTTGPEVKVPSTPDWKDEGSKQRVLADLTDERSRRQAAEAALAERDARLAALEQANETEVQRQIREAREAAVAETRAGVQEQTAQALYRMALRAQEVPEAEIADLALAFNAKAVIKADGEIDEEKLSKIAARLGGKSQREAGAGDYGAGRGNPGTGLSRGAAGTAEAERRYGQRN